jgi:O-antigen/teichoic acid export membrane protein
MGVMNLILCGCIFWFGKLHPSFGSLVNVYFSFFLLQGVALAIAFIWHNNSLSSISLPSKDELKLLLRYSLMALAGNLLFFFMYRIDYWFVRYYCHEAGAMGNYIQASKLAQMLLIVPQILASVVFPQTASGVPSNDIGKSILKLARVLMQVFFLLFLMLIFIGNSLFHFILGDTFNHVNMPLVLLLPGIFALSVLVLLSAFFSGKGRVRLNVIGTGIGVVVVIIGDVLLIPRFGINGAATASTIAYGIYLIYGLWHLKKMFTFRLKELFAFSLSDWRWVKQVLSNK